jgi:N-acetylglucosamine-6-phosphate deacetylase
VVAEKMARLLRETDDLREVPQAVGFRLESVYLALNGAGQRTSLERIDPRVTGALLQAGGGRVRIWDISPELTGSADAIRQMSAERIVCSICHTNCTISEGRAAVEAGARLVTHMFDMFYQAEVTDPDGGVYPAGLTDYLLVEDRAVCELIADGTHVDPLLVEVAFRCKSPERVAFVTDSSRASGLAPGEHTFDDGRTLLVGGANGGVRIPDTLILAGSALSPIDGFRNAIRMFGKDLRTASQVCSTTPARLMGLNKGELASGRDADIIVLDRELSLQHVVAGGRVVYER